MAWTQADSGSATSINGTGTTLSTRTDAKTYVIDIDLNNVALGDVFELTVNGKALSGGTARVMAVYSFVGGLIVSKVFESDAFTAQHSLDFFLKKISGTDRTFDWSVRSQG